MTRLQSAKRTRQVYREHVLAVCRGLLELKVMEASSLRIAGMSPVHSLELEDVSQGQSYCNVHQVCYCGAPSCTMREESPLELTEVPCLFQNSAVLQQFLFKSASLRMQPHS
eukprot:3907764-Amphidinium_carterae.1